MKRSVTFLSFFLLFVLLFGTLPNCQAEEILIEAESAAGTGGWVVDPHSMAQIGSSYLMAHGYGTPVPDAKTEFFVKKAGKYTVWARTRDWTAVWKRGTPAGRFQVVFNGTILAQELGTNGKDWNWQKVGFVDLPQGKNLLAFHDLTGFNGRCDAVYLTTDSERIPESDPVKLTQWRNKLTGTTIQNCRERFDLIVVGGGMSGICAATAAARTGSHVLLLQDREVLGGCNSSEIRVGLGGFINVEPYPQLGNVVREIQPLHGSGGTYPAEFYEDARKEILFKKPGSNCRLMFREHVYALEMDPDQPKKIRAVLSRNTHTGQETRFFAPLFVDATGDAVLARMAGCEVMYGREARSRFHEINAPEKADRQVMGHSVLWYARAKKELVTFPDIDWAIPFDESKVYYIRGGDWEQEAGQYRDMANETEYIRDYGLLSIYSNWAYIKNHSKHKADYAHDALDWVSPIGGKRESYRVVGDYILTQNDLEGQKTLSDKTAAITWDIDLHFPDPDNIAKFGEPFRSCAYHRGFGAPYPVPYRCLYARDCDNLFLAGRHISTSHVAFAAVRVMRTLGMLGEVVGLAASICRQEGALPRDVYAKHFDRLKSMMKDGVPQLPLYHAYTNGMVEKYHFKELGMINISHNPTPHLSERVKKAIRDLGMIHRKEHPELRVKKDLPVLNIDRILTVNEKNRPENDFRLNGGELIFDQPGGEFSQNLMVEGTIARVTVNAPQVDFFGSLEGSGKKWIKAGQGTFVLSSGLSCAALTSVQEGTLELTGGKNAQSLKTGDIEIGPNGILFCNARNALGIWSEKKTFPDHLTIDGELRGPADNHVNLGNIVLRNGKITSDGCPVTAITDKSASDSLKNFDKTFADRPQISGSEILGNFCFAGKVTARGKCLIAARRISFRGDDSVVDGGSGLFDLPDPVDHLRIESALDTFHGASLLRKTGKGQLTLAGHCRFPFSVDLRAGTLELAGETAIENLTLSGTLLITRSGQKILGDLEIKSGGRILVDTALLKDPAGQTGKTDPRNDALKQKSNRVPILSVQGKIKGKIKPEWIGDRTGLKVNPDDCDIFHTL